MQSILNENWCLLKNKIQSPHWNSLPDNSDKLWNSREKSSLNRLWNQREFCIYKLKKFKRLIVPILWPSILQTYDPDKKNALAGATSLLNACISSTANLQQWKSLWTISVLLRFTSLQPFPSLSLERKMKKMFILLRWCCPLYAHCILPVSSLFVLQQ